MPISHQCTACGHAFRAPDALSGKLVKCPSCKEPNRMPAAKSPTATGGNRPKREAPLRRAQSLDAPSLDTPSQPAGRGSGPSVPTAAGTAPTATPASVATPPPVAAPVPPTATAVPPVAGHAPSAAAPRDEFVAVNAEPNRGASPDGEKRRPRRRGAGKQTVPIWMWIIIGAMGLGAAGGAAAMVLPGLLAGSDDKPVVVTNDDTKETAAPPETKEEMLARCIKATVKIKVRRANGEGGVGAGFIIDKEKGWVATNHHVIEGAVFAEVEFKSGASFEVEGVVIAERKMDLAIIQLRDMPITTTQLSLSPTQPIKVTDDVYAIGAPSGLFATTPGNVTNTLETYEMPADLKAEVRRHMQDDGNLDWVQHTAKISGGNSGGPLINDRGEVIGVNALGIRGVMSFAIGVRHLRDLLESAPEEVTQPYGVGPVRVDPPPKEKDNEKENDNDTPGFDDTPGVDPGDRVPPKDDVPPKTGQKPDVGRIDISSQRIRQLAEQNAARGWTPESPEQYAQLQDLARTITFAQFSRDSASLPKISRAAIERESRKVFEQLSQFAFNASSEQIGAVNRFAPAAINSPGVGAFFYAKVIYKQPGNKNSDPIVILKLIGTEQLAIIPVTKEFEQVEVNSRWLILGVRSNKNLTVTQNGQAKDTYLVATKQLLLVKRGP